MICPMLSQSQRDEEGNVSWDHHDCIEGACTFWSDELSDCGIRASGLVTITRARSVLSGQDPETIEAGTDPLIEALGKGEPSILEPIQNAVESANAHLKDTGLKLLEGVMALEGPIKASSHELREKLASLTDDIGSIPGSVAERVSSLESRLEPLGKLEAGITALRETLAPADSVDRLATRLDDLESGVNAITEGVLEKFTRVSEKLEQVQAITSGLERLESRISSVAGEAADRHSSVREGLEGLNRTVREMYSSKPDYMVDMEENLSALGGRFASLSEHLDALSSQVNELRQTSELVSQSLARESEHRDLEKKLRQKDEARDLNTRGVALFHRGALEAAESSFRAALRLEAEFPEALNNLGLALGKQNKTSEAEECFRKALEIEPGLTEAVNNLGFLFHKGMEFEKAADMFRQAALSGEDASLAYTNLGSACYKLGKYSEAVDAWKKAVERNPLNENAVTALKMFEQIPPEQV